jgi:Zn-dependent protease with chaperone function
MWFDGGELKKAVQLDREQFGLELDADVESSQMQSNDDALSRGDLNSRARQRLSAIAAGMLPLPNLFLRSVATLVLLYGLLGLVLIACIEMETLPAGLAVGIGAAVILLQYALGPWIMDFTLRWLYQFTWTPREDLPGHLRRFIDRVCAEQNLRFPHIGIIHDGAPNAFTYGHTPNNMRIVISQGILDLLEPEESEAVVAHEIGHGKHWDMVLMTIAHLVPLLLYYVYRTLIRMRSSGRDKSAAGRIVIAIGAYVLYIVSEYIVLWFSRTREYHADRFAGRVTGNPNALASALVKIAYGLAARGGSEDTDRGKNNEQRLRHGSLDSIGAMGIFDPDAAKSLVMSASVSRSNDASSNVGAENLKSVMQWDLWNPWAAFYELNSTHPLIAHRLQYLADQAAAMNQTPYIVFDRNKPESYWDEFMVDLIVLYLPLIGLSAAICSSLLALGSVMDQPLKLFGFALAGFGAGTVLKTLFSYRSNYFVPVSVAGLLHKVKVSAVRPVPARLKGTIIGRGVPGLIWSEDFVMQDKSGILFLDYRQPLRIWDWLFGLLRSGEYAGQTVEVTGWFRRAPVPYLEIATMTAGGQTRRCYSYHVKLVFSILMMVGGFIVVFLS